MSTNIVGILSSIWDQIVTHPVTDVARGSLPFVGKAMVAYDITQIKKNQKKLECKLQELESKLGKVELLGGYENFTTGMKHFILSRESKTEESSRLELFAANEKFRHLVDYNIISNDDGPQEQCQKSLLSCLGYWGIYQCFLVAGDDRHALRYAYECMAKHTEVALVLDIFPYAIFSHDFLEAERSWSDSLTKLGYFKEALDKYYSSHDSLWWHATKQAFRFGAAGATAAVAAGITVSTAFASIGTTGLLGLWATKEVWEKLDQTNLVMNPGEVNTISSMVKNLEKMVEQSLARMKNECEDRRLTLEHTSLEEWERVVQAFHKSSTID